MPALCDVEREGRRCDLIANHHGLHMWLNPAHPLVVAWGYTNSDDTNPPGQGPASGWGRSVVS
jgi:hypothetical protein